MHGKALFTSYIDVTGELSLLVRDPDEAGRAQRVPLDDQRHGGRAVALRTLRHRVAQPEHTRAEHQASLSI
jgi:hypothetical protein